MNWLEFLKRLVDPHGPIGDIASPSEIYKARLGLPISSPHSMRATVTAPNEIVEKALASAKFVALEEATDVPRSRVRAVSAFVEEHWAPVYQSTSSTDLFEILRASQTQIGWRVTQQQTRASMPRAAQFEEVAQTVQIQATDEFYNGFYPTIPGTETVLLDGKFVPGATVIRGGRREYEEKTAGFVHWDKSFAKQRIEAQAEMDSRPVRNVRRNLDRVAGETLPMRRLLANPRYDRKSSC